MGKSKATVVTSNPMEPGCPYPGCIKVIHPRLFGYLEGIEDVSSPQDIIDHHIKSPWIEPHYSHPMDFYIPLEGETVYIEDTDDNTWIWTGVAVGVVYTDPETSKKRDPFNYNILSSYDRIIGLRNGSYIRLMDTGKDGNIVIECMGSTMDAPKRTGPFLAMQGAEGKNAITLSDGKKSRGFVLGSEAGKEEIAVYDRENLSRISFTKDQVNITAFEKTVIAMTKEATNYSDGNNNKVTIDKDGTKLEDANGNKVTTSGEGWTVEDKNGNKVTLGATGAVITATKGIILETGDASTWIPNTLAVCPFTGAPHGGPTAGIMLLKGK